MTPIKPRPLTLRETEVMDRLVQGDSFAQAAKVLHCSLRTARQHAQNVKAKAAISGPVHRLVVWYIAQKAA